MKKLSQKIIISAFIAEFLMIISEIYHNHYLTNAANGPMSYLLSFVVCTLSVFVCGYIICFAAAGLCEKSISVSARIDKQLSSPAKKAIAICYLIITVIVYFVCYFAYFPGTAGYDYKTSFEQALGVVSLSNHHPIFYTFIWKIFQTLTSFIHYEFSADVLYAIFQISLVLMTCLYMIKWMQKNKIPTLWIIISGAYFLLTPTLHLFAFSPTKDVPFACAMIFFITNLCDYLGGRAHIKVGIVSGVLACLLRHNMIYIMVALAIILFGMRYDVKKIIALMVPVIVIPVLTTKLLLIVLDINDTEPAEYLSAPIQQIAALYQFDAYFTTEEREKIRQYLTEVEGYNYRISDPVKSTLDNELYRENPSDFWKIYFSGLRQNPVIYFCAFLDTNCPYLCPKSDYLDEYNQREFIEMGQNPGADGTILSETFSFARGFYDAVGDGSAPFMRLPFLFGYFSLSFPLYSILIALFIISSTKCSRDGQLICVFYLLLMLTYVLGPVSNYRYVYPVYLASPLYFGGCLLKNREN